MMEESNNSKVNKSSFIGYNFEWEYVSNVNVRKKHLRVLSISLKVYMLKLAKKYF